MIEYKETVHIFCNGCSASFESSSPHMYTAIGEAGAQGWRTYYNVKDGGYDDLCPDCAAKKAMEDFT